MSDHAIEISNLTKVFAKRIVLDRLQLEVPDGEIFVLLGPNGAGKTTLIKILCGLILAEQGEAKVFGWDIVSQLKQVKGLISFVVGEERSFYWRLTARQNLDFFATLYNLPKKEARRRIGQACEWLGIENLNRRYQEYSTGIKYRLAIARSLLCDAKLIFMDEPTKSLDPMAASQFRDLIKKDLNQRLKKTIFFTTHNLEEAKQLGHRVAFLDQGRLKNESVF